MKFEILDNITMADIAFRAYGKNLDELFINGVRALLYILLEDSENITPDRKFNFQINEKTMLIISTSKKNHETDFHML